jgi:hypothetical protein
MAVQLGGDVSTDQDERPLEWSQIKEYSAQMTEHSDQDQTDQKPSASVRGSRKDQLGLPSLE